MPYITSTYVKPSQSQSLLTFQDSKPQTKPPQTYYALSSSVKRKKPMILGPTVVINPSKLTKAEYSAKIKASSQKLKNKYDAILKAKHCSQVIKISDRPQIIMSITEPVCKKEKPKKPLKSKTVCMSTLKSGKPCTASAKDGSKFCGRHGA